LDSASVLGVAVESEAEGLSGGRSWRFTIFFAIRLNRSENSGCKVEVSRKVGILADVINVGWNAIG
jgi:hypothetical protein